jgi:hypothetical protein
MEMDNKKQLVSCGNARIVEKINCDIVEEEEQQCIPDCTGKVCGNSDGCGGSCTFCSGNNVCVQGLCEPMCQNNNQCSGKVCVNNVCQLCGNGVVDSGEECDGVTGCGEDCNALPTYICNSVMNTCYS